MTINEVNSLGQILDSTYGKSSTFDGTRSIKTSLTADKLVVKYMTIVHFASENGLNEQVGRSALEAAQMINSYMKEVKARFKEEAGRALKAKDVGGSDNIELIQSTARSPRKIAYYRVNRTFEIQ